jgi:energy-coupling factor transporter transmembrane protein EcfT
MAFCGMPARAVRSFAVLGLGVFLPFFLLAPFLVPRAAPGAAGWAAWTRALVGPWDVVLHGLAGMFVGAATVTSLSASDFRRGLLALPLPHSVAAVLIQIVHQTGVLLSETSRVSAAVAVRAGAGAGPAAWRALFSLPRVWLPRIMIRAERVAAAMDMRGYAEADLRILGGTTLGWPDWGALAGACLALALAAALRWGGMP